MRIKARFHSWCWILALLLLLVFAHGLEPTSTQIQTNKLSLLCVNIPLQYILYAETSHHALTQVLELFSAFIEPGNIDGP